MGAEKDYAPVARGVGDDVGDALRHGVVHERALRPLVQHLLPRREAVGSTDDARQRRRALEKRAVVVRDLERRRHAVHHGMLGRDRLGEEDADPGRTEAPLLAAVVPDGGSGEAHLRLCGTEGDEAVGDGGGVVAPGTAADVHAAAADVLAQGAGALEAERLDLPEHRPVAAAGHDEDVEAGKRAVDDVLREDEVGVVAGPCEHRSVVVRSAAGAVERDPSHGECAPLLGCLRVRPCRARRP